MDRVKSGLALPVAHCPHVHCVVWVQASLLLVRSHNLGATGQNLDLKPWSLQTAVFRKTCLLVTAPLLTTGHCSNAGAQPCFQDWGLIPESSSTRCQPVPRLRTTPLPTTSLGKSSTCGTHEPLGTSFLEKGGIATNWLMKQGCA